MTDWDRYLPQVMGAYNSTQHSTTGISPNMMLTGNEKSLPLTFVYPEYEGKETSSQVSKRDVIRRQQDQYAYVDAIRSKPKRGRGKSLTRRQLLQKLTQ